MKAIGAYIGSLPAGGESPRLAQLILLDALDCCGIDFGGLIAILEESLQAVKAFDRAFLIVTSFVSQLNEPKLKCVNEPLQFASQCRPCNPISSNSPGKFPTQKKC